MLINYIKIAWRNLLKQKLYSLINIGGLAAGLSVCMLIMLFVAHELSYDRFHKNLTRTFVLGGQLNMGGMVLNMENTGYSTGQIAKQNEPRIEDYSRTMAYFRPVVVSSPTAPADKFLESKLLFADANFFKFFSFKLLQGKAEDVLSRPFSVVLSAEMAKKYFGAADPVGKTITIKTDSAYTYQVTGVAQNNPSNSSITYNFIASNPSLLAMKESRNYTGSTEIGPGSFALYLLLKNAADTGVIRRDLNAVVQKNKSYADIRVTLTPLVKMHAEFGNADVSKLKYLKVFPLVAGLILLLALVNYMSLSTARATLRAKEVGVRKVTGASRKTIAAQFYVESALYAVLSFVLGYILCYLFKPSFLNVLDLRIDNSFLYNPLVLALLGGLLLLTVIVAGSYPSLVLSAFKPVVTLKGSMSKQTGGVTVRKVFTTLQFAISVALIICGIVIDRQLYYFRHADTGIDRENVVMIPVGSSFGKSYAAFKREVSNIAGVSSVATSHYQLFSGYDMFFLDGAGKEKIGISSLVVDDRFVPTLGIKWKYPPVSGGISFDKTKLYVNETAAEKLHLTGNPVGQTVKEDGRRMEIAGVLRNFNFNSLEHQIDPLALSMASDTASYWSKWGCNLFARIKPHTNIPSLLESMKQLYRKYDQDTPFTYTFADETFNAQYKAEERLASIFSIFTLITIILATLGLFGLAAFTIQQRAKEVSIRKVLGASLSAITTLLTRDFLKLVMLAIIIASPVAWWTMHNWLQNFAYRITISWWMFAIAAIVALSTAIVTISYHALKAAVSKPVKNLTA